MRASYVVPDEHLTGIGRWIAARLPHVQKGKPAWWFDPKSVVFRIYGLRPLYRCCIFDFTTANSGVGRWWRIELFGLRLTYGSEHREGTNRTRGLRIPI